MGHKCARLLTALRGCDGRAAPAMRPFTGRHLVQLLQVLIDAVASLTAGCLLLVEPVITRERTLFEAVPLSSNAGQIIVACSNNPFEQTISHTVQVLRINLKRAPHASCDAPQHQHGCNRLVEKCNMERPLGTLLKALQSSLAAAIETCSGSQGSQSAAGVAVVQELRSVLLALLDSCAAASQGMLCCNDRSMNHACSCCLHATQQPLLDSCTPAAAAAIASLVIARRTVQTVLCVLCLLPTCRQGQGRVNGAVSAACNRICAGAPAVCIRG